MVCLDEKMHVFNHDVDDNPGIKSILLTLKSNNKQKADNAAPETSNMVKKYRSIIPDNETITYTDSNSPANTKQNAPQQHSPNVQKPIIVSNKHIGVYNGKFGILTNKFMMPSKNQIYLQSQKQLSKINKIDK